MRRQHVHPCIYKFSDSYLLEAATPVHFQCTIQWGGSHMQIGHSKSLQIHPPHTLHSEDEEEGHMS